MYILIERFVWNQAVNMLNQLVRMLGSSPLDETILNDPSVTATISTFSVLSLDSLKNVFATVESNEELKYVPTVHPPARSS